MKLALCIAALIGPLSLASLQKHDEATQETWRPLGTWAPHWFDYHAKNAQPASVWMQLPASIAELAETACRADMELTRAASALMPEGLELWLLEFDIQVMAQQDYWMMIVRDPATDRVSARPNGVQNKWLNEERPLVRFCDLDDDGRNEISIRQFDHNGTMLNADVLEYYTVLPDLSLRMDFRQRTDLVNLYSDRERGSIRSQLLLSTSGKLRCLVWREDPHPGPLRTAHGRLDFARSSDGYFEIVDRTNELGPSEREQWYDWTIESAAMHPKDRAASEARKVR